MKNYLVIPLCSLLSFFLTSASLVADAKLASQEKLTPVVMQLDWIFNAQFAGLYQAIEQGYFEAVGLDVELRGGVTTANTVELCLDEPKISFGSCESNVLMAARAKGLPVVGIGTMFQDSPMGWMYSADSGIETFADLANKNIGTHSDGIRVVKLLLQQEGVDASEIKWFDASHDPAQVIDGRADALQCYYIDEFVKLQQMIGDRAKIFLARDHGYKAYSQVVFTGEETIKKHPKVVAQFLSAMKKGWAYAFANKEATVDLIQSDYNAEADKPYQLASLKKIEELMRDANGELFAPMDMATWESGQAYLLKYDLIPNAIELSDLIQQQFLPVGDGDGF